MSQAPIREALRELEGSGLVTSERYRGTRVRGADSQEMRESYELRATLEVRAVELAIPCAPEVLESLETCLRLMKAAIEQLDWPAIRPKTYVTPEGLEEICAFIRPSKGSTMHFSGSHRCEAMRACYADPTVR